MKKSAAASRSHSWWWDSHISPKNSKWLAENLEEMDQSVKRMLKLIEEDADSFAKKAEMYYAKRPELVSLVEDFYRMYRSLAERYDHVTGELRKSVPAELQSQGSSDIGSPASVRSKKHRPPKATRHRAAGFDVFLGSGGSTTDRSRKSTDSDSSSSSDSSSDSDVSDESIRNPFLKTPENNNHADLQNKEVSLESEVSALTQKLSVSEVELKRAKSETEKIRSESDLKTSEYSVLVRKLEEEGERLKTELEKSRRHVDQLTAGIGRQAARVADLQDLITAKDSEITEAAEKFFLEKSDLEREVTDLVKSRLNLEEDRERWISKAEKLEAEIGLMKTKKSDIEIRYETLKAENSARESRLEGVNRELDELKAIQGCLESEKNALEARVSELLSLVNLRRDRAIAEAANKLLSVKEKSLAEKELGELLRSHEILQAELERLRSKGESLESEIVRLRTERTELENRFEASKAENSVKEAQLERMIRELGEAKVQYDGLISEKDEIEARLHESADSARKLSSEKYSVERKLSNLSRSSSILEEELRGWKLKAESLKSELMILNVDKLEAEVRFEKMRAEKFALDGRLEEVTQELENARVEHGRLTSKKEGLESRTAVLEDAAAKSSAERVHIMEEISLLSQIRSGLEVELREWMSKAEMLESDLQRHSGEKSEVENRYETVRMEVSEKVERLAEANREMDGWKHKYDMMVAERDTLKARILDLEARSESSEIQIRDMEKHLHELHLEHAGLIFGAAADGKRIKEAEAQIVELQEEVKRLKLVVSDGAEEKREVIRQLCFSLDHLKGSYDELRQALRYYTKKDLAPAS